ncbi:HvfC/BufC N-terminal domain-containing protein [Roseovarius salinarum]|uniref:HvfC/BufC N-terminal domain-containing protein n=1 Tax=Roseovarius salinarum TaxID=1981892 RepID=UPI000C336E54|nr:DNA-binding domain-containing protein [Roseovarius salinarum]
MTVSQAQLHDALLDGARPAPAGLTDGHGRPAGGRFAVYRNNVAVALTDALEANFPAVASLLGPANFRNVMGIFLRRHPPARPMIAEYGAGLPAFLDGFEPLGHLGYLGDVARLEQALRAAYHAADAAPVDPAVFEALAPDALMQSRLTLAPAVRLVRSNWPVHAIRAYALEPGAPKPPAQPQDVLIQRPEYDPQMTTLPPGAAGFVTTVAAGHTLGAAHDAALAEAADFDLAQTLALLLSGGAITEITPGETP